MIGRRSLLVAGGAYACLSRFAVAEALAIPASGRIGFNVVRKGSVIGTHTLTFEGDGDNPIVHVAVDLAVGIGPIKLFRYTHRATETWRDGKVFSVVAETNNDGKRLNVKVDRSADGFAVSATKIASYTAPENALPATHWYRKMLDGPMINTQNGMLMHPTVTAMGEDQIPSATGGPIRASHFNLSGDAQLDTWYDAGQNWVGIAFKAADGSEVRYEKL